MRNVVIRLPKPYDVTSRNTEERASGGQFTSGNTVWATAQQDIMLSRMGAHFLCMNGDPLDFTGSGELASPFDVIRREDERGEFWDGRELGSTLEYSEWRKVRPVVEEAMQVCADSGFDTKSHFESVIVRLPDTIRPAGRRGGPAETQATVQSGQFVPSVRETYRLSRYACYLVALGADRKKPVVAKARSYFAGRAHQAEETQRQATLPVSAHPEGLDMIARLLEIHDSGIRELEASTSRRIESVEARLSRVEVMNVGEYIASSGSWGRYARRGKRVWLSRIASTIAAVKGVEPIVRPGVKHVFYDRSIWQAADVEYRRRDES